MWVELNRQLGDNVKLVQFAVDGNWETAWKIKESGFTITQQELDAFLPPHFDHLSCELFLEDQNGITSYIGVRYPRVQLPEMTVAWFQMKQNMLLGAKRGTRLPLLDRIQRGCGPLSFAHNELHLIEVGIVDYWKTLGSIVLWQRGEAEAISQWQIEQKLKDNPRIKQTRANYQGLEFAFAGDFSYWVGVQLSTRVNGIYQIDEKCIHDNVERLWGNGKE